MATVGAIYEIFKAALLATRPVDAGSVRVPLRWQNENEDSEGNAELPDAPAPFIYSEYLVDHSRPIEIGGGRGRNRHRNAGRIDVFVFVPKGQGVKPATDIANQVDTLFRPFNASGMVVDSVTVSPGGDGAQLKPKGLSSLVDNYYYATVAIDFHADQIG